MLQTEISLESRLSSLIEMGPDFNFKENPHFIPVYIFAKLREKYCPTAPVLVGTENFFSTEMALCECSSIILPEGYSSWLLLSKSFETSTYLEYFIGKERPLKEQSRSKYSTIRIGYTFFSHQPNKIEKVFCATVLPDLNLVKKYLLIADACQTMMSEMITLAKSVDTGE